jgi:hypothetical protein
MNEDAFILELSKRAHLSISAYMAPELIVNYFYQFLKVTYMESETDWIRQKLILLGENVDVINEFIVKYVDLWLWPCDVRNDDNYCK